MVTLTSNPMGNLAPEQYLGFLFEFGVNNNAGLRDQITIYMTDIVIIPPSTREVTFNTNGGTGAADPISVIPNLPYGTLPAGLTKDGYVFSGWWTMDGSVTGNWGVSVNSSTVVAVNGDHTLYARWIEPFIDLSAPDVITEKLYNAGAATWQVPSVAYEVVNRDGKDWLKVNSVRDAANDNGAMAFVNSQLPVGSRIQATFAIEFGTSGRSGINVIFRSFSGAYPAFGWGSFEQSFPNFSGGTLISNPVGAAAASEHFGFLFIYAVNNSAGLRDQITIYITDIIIIPPNAHVVSFNLNGGTGIADQIGDFIGVLR